MFRWVDGLRAELAKREENVNALQEVAQNQDSFLKQYDNAVAEKDYTINLQKGVIEKLESKTKELLEQISPDNTVIYNPTKEKETQTKK